MLLLFFDDWIDLLSDQFSDDDLRYVHFLFLLGEASVLVEGKELFEWGVYGLTKVLVYFGSITGMLQVGGS